MHIKQILKKLKKNNNKKRDTGYVNISLEPLFLTCWFTYSIPKENALA